MEQKKPIPNHLNESLRLNSEETIAITHISVVVLEMMKEFIEFKKVNPTHPKLKLQAKRFDKLINNIDILNSCIFSAESIRNEVNKLRWNLAWQSEFFKTSSDRIMVLENDNQRLEWELKKLLKTLEETK